MKLTFVAALLFFAVLTPTSFTFAQTTTEQPLEELFMTETVYPQDKREIQITVGSQFSKSSGRKLFQTPMSIEYGLTDKLQISLEWAPTNRLKIDGETFRGLSDMEVGLKYSWMNIGKSNFHIATGFDLGVPSGSVKKELGEGAMEYEPYVVVAKDFPHLSRLQLFSQFGFSVAQPVRFAADDDDDEKSVSKGIEWNNGFFVAYKQTAFATELNWEKNGEESTLYLTPGIVWSLPRDLELGLGVPIGMTKSADSFRVIVKLSYEFGGSKKSDDIE
jgi:hypothetical protein